MRRLTPIIYLSHGRSQLLLNFEASEKRTAFFFDAVMVSKDVENSENALYKIVWLNHNRNPAISRLSSLRKSKRPITLHRTPSEETLGRRFCVAGEVRGGENQKK